MNISFVICNSSGMKKGSFIINNQKIGNIGSLASALVVYYEIEKQLVIPRYQKSKLIDEIHQSGLFPEMTLCEWPIVNKIVDECLKALYPLANVQKLQS